MRRGKNPSTRVPVRPHAHAWWFLQNRRVGIMRYIIIIIFFLVILQCVVCQHPPENICERGRRKELEYVSFLPLYVDVTFVHTCNMIYCIYRYIYIYCRCGRNIYFRNDFLFIVFKTHQDINHTNIMTLTTITKKKNKKFVVISCGENK